MDDLKYKMVMALSAADLEDPLCEQVAEICAEIADQHCTQLHVTRSAETVEVIDAAPAGPPRL
jgi:hypothetical protein